jgi:integrase/recombinase XerD
MTEAPISPLRRRMIEDMTIRKFAPRTQEGYIRAVKDFSAFLGASPDRASFEDLRRYQLHLVASGAGTPTINHTVTALRFLFIVTLRKPQIVIRLPFIREPWKLPIVLSPEEVARLLDAAPSLKYKAALSVAYGAGPRASEIISLKIEDIDGTRMVIRVEQGKGRKDRYVMLSPYLHGAHPSRTFRMSNSGAPSPLQDRLSSEAPQKPDGLLPRWTAVPCHPSLSVDGR